MQIPSIIVLVVDRLRPAYLGPYGNTWSDTPTMNELGAISLLAEYCLTDTDKLDAGYQSLWSGAHAAVKDHSGTSLIQQAADAGLKTALLTDDPELDSLADLEPFSEKILLPQSPCHGLARSVDQTQFAELAASAVTWLENHDEPVFLWVHARGLSGPWDAPLELRAHLMDEESPGGPNTSWETPRQWIEGDVDPDHLLSLSVDYAAQVQVVDDCLLPWVSVLSQPRFRQAIFALTSTRGFPLGEHRVVGDAIGCPYSECLHVPLFLRIPDSGSAAGRVQSIVQSRVLYETLSRVLQNEPPDQESSLIGQWWGRRPAAALAVCHDGQRALRSPAWHLAWKGEGSPSLFAKPDDVWEGNDVADLCPDIVNLLREQVEPLVAATVRGDDASPLERDKLELDRRLVAAHQ